MTFAIPADVAEHVRKVAEVLDAHRAEIDRLWSIWADTDPDPENGDFWHVQIAHPDADRLRRNLGEAAAFLRWLAAFTDQGGRHD